MLDTLQVIFWSITYVLIIIAGFQSREIKKVSMPYVTGILNFSWEICALYDSGGLWGHVLWLGLDTVIAYFNFIYLPSAIHKARYMVAVLSCTLILLFVFAIPQGMLFSAFLIDLLVAVVYLSERKKLSPKLKLSIAITRLMGDLFAALFYAPGSDFVAFLSVPVFICNVFYLYLCIKERRLLDNT